MVGPDVAFDEDPQVLVVPARPWPPRRTTPAPACLVATENVD